jgi:hypothetical protein
MRFQNGRKEVGEERGCGSISSEGGRAVGEERTDRWAQVARERRKGLRGSGLARRLLGWSFPGRPSSCPFSFFICFFFYFLSCLFDLFETKLFGFD